MVRDWLAWYEHYDDPESSLSQRLQVVREQVRETVTGLPPTARLLSLCAGDGRDTLPVLAEVAPEVSATLVELDPGLADRARSAADGLGLPEVTVRAADAGHCRNLADAVPADVLLLCGVFGNITDHDVANTVSCLPTLMAPDGVVIWTRGCRVPRDPSEFRGDPSEYARTLFARHGFVEQAFIRPDAHDFRVGVHRFVGEPKPADPAARLFAFVD